MPLPSMEQFGLLLVKAIQAVVKEISEVIEVIINKLKEIFGGLI
jgi:hypothetical protein